MNAVGVHAYAGGFALGLQRCGVKVEAVVESWEPAARLQTEVFHLNRVPMDTFQFNKVADITFGNPPCSRFSNMSFQAYSTSQRTNLSEFQELKDVIDVGIRNMSNVIWWENGPIAFTRGHDLIAEADRYIRSKTSYCKTLVLKANLFDMGWPQLRPRTHVMHFTVPISLSGLPVGYHPQDPVYKFIHDDYLVVDTDPYSWHNSNMEDPVAACEYANSHQGFNAAKPRVIDEEAPYSFSVLSSRQFAWRKRNRWWSINEYGAAMDYPPLDYSRVGIPQGALLMLFAKSVSPAASSWVYTNVVQRALEDSLTGPTHVEYDGDVAYGRIRA